MSDFDYVIRDGGCAGLSLAYELEINGELEDRSLAIIDPRGPYQRDKTWSFWAVDDHHFKDCVIGRWTRFKVDSGSGDSRDVSCSDTPYETIDSGLFYDKVLSRLRLNPRIRFIDNPHGFDHPGHYHP